MIIVAGHLRVDPDSRASYLEGCHEVVRQARSTSGCLDFALSADLLDPGRINVLELDSASSMLIGVVLERSPGTS